MKARNLRLIAITLAVLACWWCATSRSPLPSPGSAIAELPPLTNAVSAETTQTCQSVVYQMVAIQQFVLDESLASPVAAMDEMVAQEYRIDTSKCPSDFRLALLRFVTAENSARINANADQTGNADKKLVADMEMLATSGLSGCNSLQSNDNTANAVDGQKEDLANVQSALRDFSQLAMKYGVK